MFDEVEDLCRVDDSFFKKVKLNRTFKYFEDILNYCKFFIQNTSFSYGEGKIKAISFLFPMEVLFEEFIREFLKRNKDKISLNIDKELKEEKITHIIGKKRERKSLYEEFDLECDILLKLEEKRKY